MDQAAHDPDDNLVPANLYVHEICEEGETWTEAEKGDSTQMIIVGGWEGKGSQ